MKQITNYLIESRADYIETAQEVSNKLKDIDCPEGGKEIYIELSDNRKICIYNNDKSTYKLIGAYLIQNDKPIEKTHEGFYYGKEYLSGKDVSEKEAWERLKYRLQKNNIEMYNK